MFCLGTLLPWKLYVMRLLTFERMLKGLRPLLWGHNSVCSNTSKLSPVHKPPKRLLQFLT